jgi:Ti-type conjugative transfer relaxase TraA
VAIYHCSVKTIGRSGGSAVVNSAAYRSGEKLFDESLGKTFFYSGKEQDVMYKEIMAPDNAPLWVYDREKLWNAVEASEGRKDSQLAREIEISLPREFTTDQNIALVREYVQQEFVDRGMVADVCLHYGIKGENYNPHAHVMLSMRSIDENGFGKKNPTWNNRGLLQEWRESWAELSNKHLAINGFELRIDHRSLADQGIELVPQNVELPVDAQDRLIEQRDRQLAIMRENGERLLENPGIALVAITNSQSTFTDRDIARYVHSRTVDKEQFDQVINKIKCHPELARIAVVEGVWKYSTKAMVEMERELFSNAVEKSYENKFALRSDFVSFSSFANSKEWNSLSLEQRAAVEYITQNKDLACVVGYAGTGKTHMLNTAREIWERNGYRVHGAALSGIAAQGLEQGAGIESRTVARRLIDWDNGRDRLGAKDILVIDEAGMLGVRDLSRLMREVRETRAKVVMLGDPQQLQAISAGAAFRGIVERIGCLEMSDVRRQEISWQREATKMFAVGEVKEALSQYLEHGKIHSFASDNLAKEKIVEDWAKHLSKNNKEKDSVSESQIMLAHKRSDVLELNSMAREVLKFRGELKEGVLVATVNGEREVSKGDQIYFLRNDNGLNVRNGTLGWIKSIKSDGSIVAKVKEVVMEDLSEYREVRFNIKDYDHIDHGYASTVHKAQGMTVDRAFVFASKGFDRHLAYVSMSRHVKEVEMYWSKEEFSNFKDLQECLSRDRSKENALDYLEANTQLESVRNIKEESKLDIQEFGVEKVKVTLSQVEELEQKKSQITVRSDRDQGLEKADIEKVSIGKISTEKINIKEVIGVNEVSEVSIERAKAEKDFVRNHVLEKEFQKERVHQSFTEMVNSYEKHKEANLKQARGEFLKEISIRDERQALSKELDKQEFLKELAELSLRESEKSASKEANQDRNIVEKLEERREINKAVSSLERYHGCSISFDISVGSVLKCKSLEEKIGKTEYALMQEVSGDNMKLIPVDKCFYLKEDSEAHIVSRFNIETKVTEMVAVPTEKELWNREVKDIRIEYGKEVTKEISDGEFGRHRGITEIKGKEYIIMEQYDKVALIDRGIITDKMQKGDYMRIEEITRSNDFGIGKSDKTKQYIAYHDRDKQQELKLERSMIQGKSRGFEMSM